ncbi:cell division protein FtsQ [Pseudooceanicola marinus]|uniref:Cell division protein FtsQ n=1 Tax=Pseudooceanicola marinus TaxID=396013 RepID=A0A1X6ZG48_9RHOB|nr:cell division protein FtsQ/DivIB [Pseudooceanicola marinus]PJE28474.1 cell division protein FtsQ [Pseudooceanicola marinus]SLN50138.1 cell division protein FtsQ [Pseudooceanicola marinus]
MRALIRSRRKTGRHDPAPSRWAYRLQRFMLTPGYRLALRIVLPAAICFGAVHLYMADEMRRDAVVSTLYDWKHRFETMPQFMVQVMEVTGASPVTEEDIREVAELDLPRSSFDIDLPGLKTSIESLPSVAEAALQLRDGGELRVRITERLPVAIWRGRAGLDLVDPEGVVTGAVHKRLDRPDLPLLAGAGDPAAIPEALAIIAAAQPIRDRLRGLERIGERRWDVVLDRDQRIMLPEKKPVQALERVLALDEAQELLARDLVAVDMRLASRPTLRMSEGAVTEWRRIQDMLQTAKAGN